MIEIVKKLFYGNDHKVIMLRGLFLSSILIYLSLSICAYFFELESIFKLKLFIVIIFSILFIIYLKISHTKIFALLLIIILEIDTSTAIINKHFYDFVSIYPFFIIFGFFFFFRLRTALWMTFCHFVFWIFVVYFRYSYISTHPLYETYISNINMFTSSVVVVLLGVFYHLSTEVSYEQLELDDKQKDTLLKEIHHRIKNNLNMMASIMGLQIISFENEHNQDPKEILTNSKLRIEAIAMIHESLYHNKNIECVNFKIYSKNLTDLIISTYDKKIDVKIDSKVKMLHEKIVLQLGIIINELFTNSIKYAFKEENIKNRVYISLFEDEKNYIFKYHNMDNIDVDIHKILYSKKLGIKLIRLTVKQMDGSLDIKTGDGLLFNIIFPKSSR
jgi:two-component sensor histidine kinase